MSRGMRRVKETVLKTPEPRKREIEQVVELMRTAQRPVFYTGGGVINAGPEASDILRELAAETNFPVTSTLMGLGAFPASDQNWLGMLGMHGSYEANNAMHDCDLMIAIGARFDDRVTGRLDAFSPGSKKVHIDIDPSSINKNVPVDLAIIGDAGDVMKAMLECWRAKKIKASSGIEAWHKQINDWRSKNSFAYGNSKTAIKTPICN